MRSLFVVQAFNPHSTYGPPLRPVSFRPHARLAMGSRHLGQALRCWRTHDGGTVCSDLMYYAPDCPETPPLTEAETLPTPPEAAAAT